MYSYEVEPTTITVKKLLVKKNHISIFELINQLIDEFNYLGILVNNMIIITIIVSFLYISFCFYSSQLMDRIENHCMTKIVKHLN